MKKIIFLILALALVLVSCAKKSLTDEGAKENTDAPETQVERGDVVLPYSDVNLSDYIEISKDDYIGAEYTLLSSEAREADVEAEVEKFRQSLTVYVEKTDGEAEEGDRVTLDYSGSLNGVKFDGGTAQNQVITLGAGGFIDGFEEGIYSHRTGETFVVDAFFPENYGKEELRGKTAQFEMTIHKIETPNVPALTDEYLKENTDYESLDELKAALKAKLEQALQAENAYAMKNEAFASVYGKVKVLGYPEKPYQRYYDEMVNQYKAYADSYQMDFETFMSEMAGSSVEEFYSYADEYAKSTVDMELIFFSIAEAEGILDTMTWDKFNTYVETVAAEYSMTAKDFEAQYGTELIWSSLVYETVLDFIFENGVALDKSAE